MSGGKRVGTVEHRQPVSKSSEPLRVTSLNPVRDAKTIGHDVGLRVSRCEAKNTALRHRFVRLLADGETVAIAESERETRVAQLLNS